MMKYMNEVRVMNENKCAGGGYTFAQYNEVIRKIS